MDGKACSSETSIGVRHRKPRTLVLCFDGTSNEFNNRNTNVVKLYSILRKDTPESQICYYQTGVGTYFQPGVVSPFFRYGARIVDEALAWYLSQHIMDGYKFLMQNYHEGDSVCIFGFSRGAYTARALAGMLHKVGLLSKDNTEQIPFAYKVYKSSKHKHHKVAVRFKRAFSREVPIEFLGVWDTVASVGILSRRTLPFVGANNTIRVFRQALSLDECRAKFSPNLFHRTPAAPVTQSQTRPLVKRIAHTINIFHGRKRNPDTPHYTLDSKGRPTIAVKHVSNKDIKEVWFAGSHSDVGGGLSEDTDEHALSNIPLRWMIREIMRTQCHIIFDETALHIWNIPITTIERVHTAREASDSTLRGDGSELGRSQEMPGKDPTSSAREANASTSTSTSQPKGSRPPSPSPHIEESWHREDATQKMGNAFKVNVFWWILEVIPTYHEWQNEQDEWVGKWAFHLGRGRELPSHPLFHESVKARMDNPVLNYSPRAQYKKGSEQYVS